MIDLIIILGAVYLINSRYQQYKQKDIAGDKNMPVSSEKHGFQQTKSSGSALEGILNNSVEQPVQPKQTETRNILFKFKSIKARSVAIIGDFNEWIPQPLIKGSNNVWELTLQLVPGEYLYNYLIDGKVILDPNNRKEVVVNTVRGFKSSVLKVGSKLK
jgi:hypothetical protein